MGSYLVDFNFMDSTTFGHSVLLKVLLDKGIVLTTASTLGAFPGAELAAFWLKMVKVYTYTQTSEINLI